MDSQNIKVYLGISFALIILFILILVIPFSKKNPTENKGNTGSSTNQPFPTSIDVYPTASSNKELNSVPADFTGVAEETIPQLIVDLSDQKKDLRQKVPLNLTAFLIDFDYNEDKFVVFLKDPKEQSQKEFESWRTSNYSGLSAEQFILK